MIRPAVAAFIRRRTLGAVLLAPLLATAPGAGGCGPAVNLKQVLTIAEATGGWHDGGIVDGKNKLVPRVTFRLRKSTDASINPLAMNVVFKRLNAQVPGAPSGPSAEDDWDERFVQDVTFDGNQTAPLTVESATGYTGDPPQSRADILKHSQFRDMRVHVFVKHSSTQWVELGQFEIPRQLIAH